tara:strand:- start:2244 stop:3137 length:894 start_codon:yes stop_codon:yes gene_type:complete
VKAPDIPEMLAVESSTAGSSASLVDAGMRRNGMTESISTTNLGQANAGADSGIAGLTNGVLSRSAKAGSAFIAGCELDSQGRCMVHDHGQDTIEGASAEKTTKDSVTKEDNGQDVMANNEPDSREAPAPSSSGTMALSEKGKELLKSVEELRLTTYDDQTGESITSWVKGATIGYGHLIARSEWSIYENGITADQADALFESDLEPFVRAVNEKVTVPLTQNQFDAAVMLAFNIGIAGFSNSSAVTLINDSEASTSYPDLESAWKAWNRSQGAVSRGLINRRNAEWDVYSKGIYKQW